MAVVAMCDISGLRIQGERGMKSLRVELSLLLLQGSGKAQSCLDSPLSLAEGCGNAELMEALKVGWG